MPGTKRRIAKPGRGAPRPDAEILFSLEVAFAAILGVTVAFFRLSLAAELLALLMMVGLCGRMAFASPLTVAFSRSDKALLLGAATVLVGVLGYPAARERLHELRHPEDHGKASAQNAGGDVMPADLLVASVDVQPPTRDAGLKFKVHVENNGQTPAIAWTSFGGVIATKAPMDADGENKSFALLTQSRLVPTDNLNTLDRYGTADLLVGDTVGSKAVTGEELNEYIINRSDIYLMLIMNYRNASDNKPFYTEYCQYLDFNLQAEEQWQTAPARLCQGHNTTYGTPVGKSDRVTRLISKILFGQ